MDAMDRHYVDARYYSTIINTTLAQYKLSPLIELPRNMSAVGLQMIAAMDSEESTVGKWVVGASKYAALCAGAVPYAHNISTDLVEERFGIFFLEPLPPPVKPPVLKLHRCMVCRKRLAKQDVFMSRGIAFCSPECRSSDAAGRAKVDPISSRNEARKSRHKAAVPRMTPLFQQRGRGPLLTKH